MKILSLKTTTFWLEGNCPIYWAKWWIRCNGFSKTLSFLIRWKYDFLLYNWFKEMTQYWEFTTVSIQNYRLCKKRQWYFSHFLSFFLRGIGLKPNWYILSNKYTSDYPSNLFTFIKSIFIMSICLTALIYTIGILIFRRWFPIREQKC